MKNFLSSIQEKDSKEFEINFILKPSNKKKSNFWKFTSSRNNNEILKTRISSTDIIYCGNDTIPVYTFEEKLPNGIKYNAVYRKNYSFQNSDKFIIPSKYYFFLGDNRDCSKDSRFLASVGYVHENNFVGKAQFIFFSSDHRIASFFKFWKWKSSIRIERFFKIIK